MWIPKFILGCGAGEKSHLTSPLIQSRFVCKHFKCHFVKDSFFAAKLGFFVVVVVAAIVVKGFYY